MENVDDTTAIVGTQKRKRTVTVWLSNLSREPKRVKVVERIPVSEIAGLEVVWLGHKEWTLDERDGLAEREVELVDLRSQLAAFEGRYLRQVGALYAELDEWKARISELHGRLDPSASASARAREAREQARQTFLRGTPKTGQ